MASRWKKEEAKKRALAREGLSPEEIKQLDIKELGEERIERNIHKLHIQLFPEEYDHMLDSISEASERRAGVNPMSTKFVEEVNLRREQMGFDSISSNGMPTGNTRQFVRDAVTNGDQQKIDVLLKKFQLDDD
jgi:hypothetical protein